MAPQPKIAPSMLSSDFAQLAAEAKRMIDYGADYLHMDVMDGHFVPNLTMGAPIIKCLRKHTDAFLDCHLMVSNPEKWVDDFAKAGASLYCFHIEATGQYGLVRNVVDLKSPIIYHGLPVDDASGLIDKIHAAGMKAGLAVKPKTKVDVVFPLAEKLDQVLIMTVEPGFGGQKFMEDCVEKVRILRNKYPELDIEVDGGLGPDTIDKATSAGANVIVAGTAIFGAPSPKDVIAVLRDSVLRNVTNKA
ncbi:ribulose-phosphate 3-epimerase [Spizellomyces sp. 'palustris']|nr:ribulose-phosphate 3-epimerase [Spizellomyces sp. 'palustris']